MQSATVDLASGAATVLHDENAETEAMVEAVSEAGYEAQPAEHNGR